MWPADESAEAEIVIREIPDSSFDPEDIEEVIVDNADDTITEITIVENEENNNLEETIDTILEENTDQPHDSFFTTTRKHKLLGTALFVDYVNRQ
jgi:hypothetical protein